MAKENDAVRMLAKVPIFSELSNREVQGIARSAKEVTRKEGSALAREGDPGLGFFLIMDGRAKVSVGGQSRASLGPGDFFGEISLLDGGPRTATVTAATDMRLLGVTQPTFKRFVESNPKIAAKMLKVMAQRLRSSSREPTH